MTAASGASDMHIIDKLVLGISITNVVPELENLNKEEKLIAHHLLCIMTMNPMFETFADLPEDLAPSEKYPIFSAKYTFIRKANVCYERKADVVDFIANYPDDRFDDAFRDHMMMEMSSITADGAYWNISKLPKYDTHHAALLDGIWAIDGNQNIDKMMQLCAKTYDLCCIQLLPDIHPIEYDLCRTLWSLDFLNYMMCIGNLLSESAYVSYFIEFAALLVRAKEYYEGCCHFFENAFYNAMLNRHVIYGTYIPAIQWENMFDLRLEIFRESYSLDTMMSAIYAVIMGELSSESIGGAKKICDAVFQHREVLFQLKHRNVRSNMINILFEFRSFLMDQKWYEYDDLAVWIEKNFDNEYAYVWALDTNSNFVSQTCEIRAKHTLDSCGNSVCPICYNDTYLTEQMIMCINCNKYIAHEKCLRVWFMKNDSRCILCRHSPTLV
jgi:hypothetical protein